MDAYGYAILAIILFVIVVISCAIIYDLERTKEVENNWDCEDVRKHIAEQGDTKFGFYLQQLMKKGCSFP